MKKIALNEEMLNKVRELHEKGYGERGIAKEMGVSHSTIQKWIKKYINGNESIYSPVKKQKKPKREEKIIVNETPVRCSCSVAKTCIYGRAHCNSDSDKCNFMAITHKSRIAIQSQAGHPLIKNNSCVECYLYQKVSRENKRRKVAQQ